jgi:Fe-S-cluster containining protein
MPESPQPVPESPPAPAQAEVPVELSVLGARLRGKASVPAGPARVEELLPVFRMVTEGVVRVSVMSSRQHGKPVSCRKGCGACCRQMVPTSVTEARRLARLVEAMPEPRRSHVLARFMDAEARLQAAGLTDRLLDAERFEKEELDVVGMAYFNLGIACPFLENESCGIYDERPLRCREYLVVSDPKYCEHPDRGGVEVVGIPLKPSEALCRVDGTDPAMRYVKVVALTMALRYVRENPEPPPEHTGPELTRAFLEFLEKTRHPKPSPPAPDAGIAPPTPPPPSTTPPPAPPPG